MDPLSDTQQTLHPIIPAESSSSSSNNAIPSLSAAPLSSSASQAAAEKPESPKVPSQDDANEEEGDYFSKPVRPTVVRDEAENVCVHCKSSLFHGTSVVLYRCIEALCPNYFHHVCNGKEGSEDASSNRCSFCVQKVMPVFLSELDKAGCDEKDKEIVEIDKDDAELQQALVKHFCDIHTSLNQCVGEVKG